MCVMRVRDRIMSRGSSLFVGFRVFFTRIYIFVFWIFKCCLMSCLTKTPPCRLRKLLYEEAFKLKFRVAVPVDFGCRLIGEGLSVMDVRKSVSIGIICVAFIVNCSSSKRWPVLCTPDYYICGVTRGRPPEEHILVDRGVSNIFLLYNSQIIILIIIIIGVDYWEFVEFQDVF